MGVSCMGSSSSYDKVYRRSDDCDCQPEIKIVEKIVEKKLPNPDPLNWTILESKQFGKILVIRIKYHDCKNYEGEKVALYENATMSDLSIQKKLDPHFSENEKFHSPIAQFRPDLSGWKMAIGLAAILGSKTMTATVGKYGVAVKCSK